MIKQYDAKCVYRVLKTSDKYTTVREIVTEGKNENSQPLFSAWHFLQ